MLLSETYRDRNWPKGWHIFRPTGYGRWRLWYQRERRWTWEAVSSDRDAAISEMEKAVATWRS